ncbi:hypothetical protein BJX96DRAFT_176589 [Aspergillus floccosus]
MRSALALWHLLALVTRVFGDEDLNYDPASNFRPLNITDLDYWYYPWKGSYYNGSAIFTVSDLVVRTDISRYEDTTLCPQLENITYTFSWPAILAITQTDSEEERRENTNPVDILLVTSYSNFTKYFTNYMHTSENMATLDSPWEFQSIEASRYHYPSDFEPKFNLTVSSRSDSSPFRITGSSKLAENPISPLYMNMSSCSQIEAWWGLSPVSSGALWADKEDISLLGLTDPTLTLTFDEHSAGLSIRTSAVMNTLGGEPGDGDTPALAGKLTIEFLGRGDAARSDVLNEGDEPSWMPTVGFGNNSMNLDYGTSGAGSIRVWGMEWGLLWVGVAVAYILCL